MKKSLFSKFARRLYGPSGRYWLELGTLEAVWRYSFLDQYSDGQLAAEASVQRYCCGWSRFPSSFKKRYSQPDGLDVLIKNMERVVGCSCSLKRLRTIQQGVHDWLKEAAVDRIDVDELNRYFVDENTNKEEVAVYLATVMHKIIAIS